MQIQFKSISRIFNRTSTRFNCNEQLITTTTKHSSSMQTSALSKKDKQKLISQHKYIVKSEYERACAIRSHQYRKLKQQLEEDKKEDHKIFSRVFYRPQYPDKYEATDVTKLDSTPCERPKPFKIQRTGVIAQKIGMTTMFDSKGVHHPITMLKINCCQVVHVKETQHWKHGTFPMQLGCGIEKIDNLHWRVLGHYNAHKIAPKQKLWEFYTGHEALIKPGTELTCRHFLTGQFVDIKGISKDKGFQGVMKRWGFKGGPATHGSSKFHRRRGCMGGSMDPGKVWKGKRMPGHMGNNSFTQQNIRIFRIEPKQNLIYVIGHVPGYMDDFVKIRDAHFRPPKNPPFPTFIPNENEKELPEFTQWDGDKKNRLWMRDPNPEEWLDDKVTPDLL